MANPNNIIVKDAIHGIAGELTPSETTGRMTFSGKEMAFLDDCQGGSSTINGTDIARQISKNGIQYDENSVFCLYGASFGTPINGWFESACAKLGVTCINKCANSIYSNSLAGKLKSGTAFTQTENEQITHLIIMFTHNYDVFDESILLPNWRDYTVTGWDYATQSSMIYDYILNKYLDLCYARRTVASSKWYGTEAGKPFQVILCTDWHDGRSVYNESVRKLAAKWGLPLITFDENIGFTKNHPMLNSDGTTTQMSLLYSPDTQVIDDVTYAWHPNQGATEFIQQRMASIFTNQIFVAQKVSGSSSNVTYNRSTGELVIDGEQVRNLDLGLGAVKADVVTTTSIVEGLGGILAGSFLQNEDGEDYILQKDVEAGYVKKTDLVVDSIPMLNSTHLITSGGVYTPVQQVTTDLSTHKTTDKFRWQDTYDEQLLSIVRDGESQGLKLAGSFGGAEYPLTVTDEYGGIIAMQFINPSVSIFYTVYINGQLKYSSEGLPPNIPITKYMMVKNGDVVTSLNNPNILNYNYFVADTDSPFFKMVQQVTVNQQMIGSLQNDILNVKASIDNKVLDPEPTHVQSILNSTYTVTNSLGGRLNGKGYVLLGLLGVKLVSTGIVDVTYTNGTTIREYDNTALVGAGEANPFVLDVDLGTIIVSSGMDSLTFTPYVAK